MDSDSVSKSSGFVSWLLQILAAVILLQTIYYKFTGAAESIYIFENAGLEPWGRYMSGIVELLAGLLLLLPGLNWLGAVLGLLVMTVALYVHLGVLGVEIMGDGGAMFYLATTVWICCLCVFWIRKPEIKRFFQKSSSGEKELDSET